MSGIDQKLFFLINQEWTGPLADRLMATLSSFGMWAPLLFAGFALGLVFGGFRMRAALLCTGLALCCNEVALVNPLKQLFNRARPNQTEGVRVVTFQKASPKFMALFKPMKFRTSKTAKEPVEGRSFPSGHTSNTCAVAVVFWAFFRRRSWPVWLVAVGVWYSRVYTGSHWPSDVFFSIFIGSAAAGLTLFWAEGCWRRRGAKWFPALYQRYPTLWTQPQPAAPQP